MTAPIRIAIRGAAATCLVCLTFAQTACASSGDAMSRDVEFRESLARHDGARETASPGPASRHFTRRGDASKKDTTLK